MGHLLSRRGFFSNMTDGIAGAALAYLFNRELFADASPPDGRNTPPALGCSTSSPAAPISSPGPRP